MAHKKVLPIFVLAVFVALALPGQASAATTTMTLQTDWDEGTCTGRVEGNSGITRYAVAEGDTVVLTLKNISAVSLNVLYSVPNGTGTTKTIVAGGNDVQTLTNFTTTFQVSPEPSSTFCGVSDKAYALLYADPPPYTAATGVPLEIATRQTGNGSNVAITPSKAAEAKPKDDTSQTDQPDLATQIYGDPQVSETHARASKATNHSAGASWRLIVPPLLLLLATGFVSLLRWRALVMVREYNKPKKRTKSKKRR